jgi:hypothetical protein
MKFSATSFFIAISALCILSAVASPAGVGNQAQETPVSQQQQQEQQLQEQVQLRRQHQQEHEQLMQQHQQELEQLRQQHQKEQEKPEGGKYGLVFGKEGVNFTFLSSGEQGYVYKVTTDIGCIFAIKVPRKIYEHVPEEIINGMVYDDDDSDYDMSGEKWRLEV